MKIYQIIENDKNHAKALANTGFWGNRGAGCIFISKTTGRILLNHRSSLVEQPNTWGVWGGAIDSSESPKDAVMREAYEESGYTPDPNDIIPIYVYKHPSGFRYYNFIILTEDEFTPNISDDHSWETQGWKWVSFGDWPHPLHFGVEAILRDTPSVTTIKSIIDNLS